MNDDDSNMAANAICHAAQMTQETIRQAIYQYERPSVLWRPKIYIDGNKWCALYGENLQSGVAGFGDSPDAAMWDFDRAWCAKLSSAAQGEKASSNNSQEN